MNLPQKLKIGAHWYDVEFPHKFMERTDCYGLCDYGLKKMWIAETDGNGAIRPDSSISVTFIHEILHSIERVTGHHVFANAPEEEAAINGFAECIYQVLTENNLLDLRGDNGSKTRRKKRKGR